MAQGDIGKLRLDRSLPKTGRSFWKRWRLLLAAVGIVIVAVYFSGLIRPAVQIETVTVSLLYPSSAFTLLNASGYVVAQRKAALAAKTTGRLEWLGVEEGSRIKRGEVIARLEGLDAAASRNQAAAGVNAARAQRDQAAAELTDAVRSLQRAKTLLAQGVVSQADYDAAETREDRARAVVAAAAANQKTAEAALAGADVAVDYTLIRAPFDALVLTKNADVGDIVTPLGAAANAKASVVTIADPDSLRIEVDVSESSIGKIKISQPCEILLDALPQNRFRGVVHSIVPTADRSKATIMVKVAFIDRDPRVLPEMSAKVAFLERPVAPDENRPKAVVSQGAVIARGGEQLVYLVKGDRVAAVRVEAVQLPGGMAEIRKGLSPGDRVAVKPLDKLRDGSRVKFDGK